MLFCLLHRHHGSFFVPPPPATFFVAKLIIPTLPTLVFFTEGVSEPTARLIGFEDLEGGDEFKTRSLEEVLEKHGMIAEAVVPEDSEDEEANPDNYNEKGTGKKQWSKRGGIYGFGRTTDEADE